MVAKNNVTMEPNGVITINKGVQLSALTEIDRQKRLCEIEFLMDYGDAYFNGDSPVAASMDSVSQGAQSGNPSRRRSYVPQRCVDEFVFEESNSMEEALHAARLAPVSSTSEDDEFEKMPKEEKVPKAKESKRRQEQLDVQPISLLSRAERFEERHKRIKNAEAIMPRRAFKDRSVQLPLNIPLEDRTELALNLEKETGLKVISIKADNNCMFRALAHVVFEGDDDAHPDVRDAVCNELEADDGGVYSQRFTPRIGDYRGDGSFCTARHANEAPRRMGW